MPPWPGIWSPISPARRELPHYNEADAAAGLAATWWPGRFELLPDVGRHPLLVDCAHNVDSINILLTALRQAYGARPFTFIFGAGRDKRMRPMVERLLSVSPRLVLVQSRHAKALSTADIRQELQPWIDKHAQAEPVVQVLSAGSMLEAVRLAMQITPADGLLVGTGSVFVTAELREAWDHLYPGAFPAADWVHEAAGEPDLNVPMQARAHRDSP